MNSLMKIDYLMIFIIINEIIKIKLLKWNKEEKYSDNWNMIDNI
jgi:hypothetical protein